MHTLVTTLLVLSGLLTASAQWNGTEINPSVMVLGIWDFEVWKSDLGGFQNRCMMMINEVTRHSGSRVNFIVTHYWKDLEGTNTVDYYCTMNSALRCVKFTPELIEQFRIGMQLCFQTAIDANLSIAIVPHLDDASSDASWRNGLLFDPLDKRQGFSYYDVMLKPLADALRNAEFHTDTKVWFATTGEMSATVMRYPAGHKEVIARMRNRILDGREGRRSPKNIKVGVSLNFNKIDAVNEPKNVPLLVPTLRPALISDLFRHSDFIGISAYKPMSVYFVPEDFEQAVWEFKQNLEMVHPSLVQFLDPNTGKELHYSEFGIGGGASSDGKRPVKSAEQAALLPFYGVRGPYRRSTDPWQTPWVRAFMRRFYEQAAKYFSGGGGPTFHIQACFMWNLASWDVLGIYPESTIVGQGSYRDEHVAVVIAAHNFNITARIPRNVSTIIPFDRFPDLGPVQYKYYEDPNGGVPVPPPATAGVQTLEPPTVALQQSTLAGLDPALAVTRKDGTTG